MAVPCGDQRDWVFAKNFDLKIPNIFKDTDVNEKANEDKNAIITNSEFLDDLKVTDAIKKAIDKIENEGLGQRKINYRLRDAIFSRQRYWGEPFPIYYKDEMPYLTESSECVELPVVDKYLPTETGDPPLARAKKKIGMFLMVIEWNIIQCLAGQVHHGIF